ncbi:MAG: hypothetical protein E2O53_09030, partial [Gammaproteobacteria bacterium]
MQNRLVAPFRRMLWCRLIYDRRWPNDPFDGRASSKLRFPVLPLEFAPKCGPIRRLMTAFNNVLPIALAAVSLAGFHPVQIHAQEVVQEKTSSRNWIDTVDWNGDLRLRYEGIDEAGEEKRNRFRFRGRFGFASELSNSVQFTVRLATSDGNPVSTNLDFGNGFSSKDIAIDRVFINWNALNNLDIALGKMGRPWFRAGDNTLIWDSDLNPEG